METQATTDRKKPAQKSFWSPIAEDVYSPAAATWGERGISVFMRGTGGELLVLEREEESFGAVRSLGVPTARVENSRISIPVEWPIAACSTRDGVIHLVARGAEGDLAHGRLRGKDWSGFESIGVPMARGTGPAMPMGLVGAPTACCRQPGKLEAFAVAGEGDVLHTVHEGSGFSECESIGGFAGPHGRLTAVFGPISAFDAGLRRMGLAARGPAGDVWLKIWTAQDGWSVFAPLRSPDEIDPLDPALEWMTPLTSFPAACGAGSTRADVFARGPHGHLLHAFWNGERWSPLEGLGMPVSESSGQIEFSAGPIACAWGKFRLEVFACATDGKLYHTRSNGTWAAQSATDGQSK
ncbi:MAG TPA: hypothetical protein VEP66_13785 [Myxococcales bacterium]|nr:hypothetical protein [Myxococcales bacterium]